MEFLSALMKIKPVSKKPVRKTKAYHWWLAEELPRKVGRLSQLNKHNTKAPSEFVLMAKAIEDEPRKLFSR